jgi:hypothetical protein
MLPGGSTRPEPLSGRYDRRPPVRQRLLSVGLGALLAALIGAIILALWVRLSAASVSARVLGYQVTSDSAVAISFEVDKRQGSRAYCVVRARDANGREVGRDVAEVDTFGTDQRQVRTTFELATSGRAVTGELAGCSPEPISKE